MPHVLLRRRAQGASPFIGRKGQWQAAWLPPRLAAWPFDLVQVGGSHALALHEGCDQLIEGAAGTPIFQEGDSASLSPETILVAAILKGQAETLPATNLAAVALRDHGLLTSLDGDSSILTVDATSAADLDEAAILILHRTGALALMHAGLVSLAHLPWMEKAEQHLASVAAAEPHLLPARKPTVAVSSFIAALAAETPADEALLQLPARTQP